MNKARPPAAPAPEIWDEEHAYGLAPVEMPHYRQHLPCCLF